VHVPRLEPRVLLVCFGMALACFLACFLACSGVLQCSKRD
jgi:hypothetical protein